LSGLWVKHPITVKARVTPELKVSMASEIQDAVRRIELEINQLDFQMKRVSGVDALKRESQAIRQEIEVERQKRVERRTELIARLKDIGKLADGAEVPQATVEGFSAVETGTEWDSLFSAEVLLEDGKVVEIRRGR